MASSRGPPSRDEELAERAHQLGINISAAARQGVADAVRAALERSDREAHPRRPERADTFWTEAEAWGEP
ncbi:MAG: type II toxin-antitoxin system CcdA family antitoxin [Acidimicrobiales bacterium]